MALKSDAKLKEKLTCGFKYDMTNLVNFHPTTQKSKNFTPMGYFVKQVYEVWAAKIQKSYLSWNWTVIQNLKNPDLVVSKMAWGIGWLSSLEHPKVWKLYIDGLFLSKVYTVSARELSKELCVMTLKGVAKFKRQLTCGLENDIRNLVNFHVSSWKSGNLHFD